MHLMRLELKSANWYPSKSLTQKEIQACQQNQNWRDPNTNIYKLSGYPERQQWWEWLPVRQEHGPCLSIWTQTQVQDPRLEPESFAKLKLACCQYFYIPQFESLIVPHHERNRTTKKSSAISSRYWSPRTTATSPTLTSYLWTCSPWGRSSCTTPSPGVSTPTPLPSTSSSCMRASTSTEPSQSQPYTGAFYMEMGLKSQTWRLNVSFSKFIFPRVLSSDITRLLYTSLTTWPTRRWTTGWSPLSTFYSMLWSPDCSTMPTAPLCPRSDTWLLWSPSLTWCSTRLESAFEHYMS